MGREERDRKRHANQVNVAGSIVEAQAVAYLHSLPPAELVRVMRQVFATNVPFPSEHAFCRSKWFLGIASSVRSSEPVEWEPWVIEAAAYNFLDGSRGPDDWSGVQ